MRLAFCHALILLASLLMGRAGAQSSTNSPTPPPAQPTLPAPYITRQPEIEVPFSVKAAGPGEPGPAAVRIYVSWDRGANWHLYQEKRPDEAKFRFRAKQDGEFWFATQTVDSSGRTPRQTPKSPQLRLVVDTQKPALQLTANPTADGKLALSWSASDPHLNATSLVIEYQDASASGPWQSIVSAPAGPTSPGASTGQVVVQPVATSGSIILRAEIADVAGNSAYFSQRVALARAPAGQAAGTAVAPSLADSSSTPWPADDGRTLVPTPANTAIADESNSGEITNPYSPPSESSNRLASLPTYRAVTSSTLPPVAGAPTFDALPPPGNRGEEAETVESPRSPFNGAAPSFAGPLNSGRGIPASPATSSLEPRAPLGSLQEGPGIDRTPSWLPTPKDEGNDGSALPLRPSTEDLPSPGNSRSTPPRASSPEPIRPQRPGGSGDWADSDVPPGRPRMTNTRRFSLEYDVETVGPEGLADVELWGTVDQGQTWAKWGSDPDKSSPFDVEVNGEGTYGFRVVIVGNNGLASNTPQAGDTADIWVGVDQTRPTARITSAAYGSGAQAGKLDIRWEASDSNLSSRPVTLSMSERADGPFTPIAAGLPNTGQYFWDFDPRSPRQLYLRLEVRDDAGNMTIDQLVEPIQVEGLAPKGRIRGFSPAAETGQQPFRSPLFR